MDRENFHSQQQIKSLLNLMTVKLKKYTSIVFAVAILSFAYPCLVNAKEDSPEKETVNGKPNAYEYYYVSGNTFKKLVEETLLKGPQGPDGTIYPALTKFVFTFSYSYDHTVERTSRGDSDRALIKLDFKKISMKKEITVALPKLVKGVKLSPKNRKLWERNLKKLDEHEMDHVEIIIDPRIEQRYRHELLDVKEIVVYIKPGKELTDKLVSEHVKKRADRVGERIIKRVQRINNVLDELTGHGLKPYDKKKFFAWIKY